ncbi:hypothetical protein EMIT048CA2_80172 [Pseudomonas chlororaphis]
MPRGSHTHQQATPSPSYPNAFTSALLPVIRTWKGWFSPHLNLSDEGTLYPEHHCWIMATCHKSLAGAGLQDLYCNSPTTDLKDR